MTTPKEWAVVLPWMINNLPREQQRVRFLRALMWAMPERAQQVGRLVALGVDGIMWARLTVQVPEMVPRGMPGWLRYY